MHLSPTLRYYRKNNAHHITYMSVLIFLKNLDLRKNAYSQTASWGASRFGEKAILQGGCR